jgi:hypothetical protein
MVARNIAVIDAFNGLSAVKLGHWPIVALACRHYRLPIPPYLWLPVVQALRERYRPGAPVPATRLKLRSTNRSRRAPHRRLQLGAGGAALNFGITIRSRHSSGDITGSCWM